MWYDCIFGKFIVLIEKLVGIIREIYKVDIFKVNVVKLIVFFYDNKLEI